MRIAILTFHRAHNCGAMLQAWALRTVLEQFGHYVEFLDGCSIGEELRLNKIFVWRGGIYRTVRAIAGRVWMNCGALLDEIISVLRYRVFRKRFLPESSFRGMVPEGRYDCVIVGSDQVWNEAITGTNWEIFLGKKIPIAIPLVAYAVSCGDMPLSENIVRHLKTFPRRFVAISAREVALARQLSAIGFVDVPVVLDPTLLLLQQDYDVIATAPRVQGRLLYAYVIRVTDVVMRITTHLAKCLDAKLVITPVVSPSRFAGVRGVTRGISPGRLVGYVARADYVFAESFHGTAMAIICRKPFLSLCEKKGESTRQGQLLRALGLEDRLITPETNMEELERRLCAPLAKSIDEKIGAMRTNSTQFLREALETVAQRRG